MREVDPNVERLIVRGLDGELTEPERAELRRLVESEPDVRALYEQYCRLDMAVRDALLWAIDGEEGGEGRETVGGPWEGGRGTVRALRAGWRRLAWVGVAAAACVAAIVLFPQRMGPSRQAVAPPAGGGVANATPVVAPAASGDPWVALPVEVRVPVVESRVRQRDWIRMYDSDTGTVYFVEVLRQDVARVPVSDEL